MNKINGTCFCQYLTILFIVEGSVFLSSKNNILLAIIGVFIVIISFIHSDIQPGIRCWRNIPHESQKMNSFISFKRKLNADMNNAPTCYYEN